MRTALYSIILLITIITQATPLSTDRDRVIPALVRTWRAVMMRTRERRNNIGIFLNDVNKNILIMMMRTRENWNKNIDNMSYFCCWLYGDLMCSVTSSLFIFKVKMYFKTKISTFETTRVFGDENLNFGFLSFFAKVKKFTTVSFSVFGEPLFNFGQIIFSIIRQHEVQLAFVVLFLCRAYFKPNK